MASTPGLKFLDAAGVSYQLHPYDYDSNAEAVGLAAATALGIDPSVMLKTLMVEVDGKPACCVIPSDRQLSMKKVAAAFRGKAAVMMPPPKAERLTGYHVGGISPFGQKKPVRTAFELTATSEERVWINAGARGLLLSLAPAEALRATSGLAAPLIA